jgi:PAS domain S-box-containing protein
VDKLADRWRDAVLAQMPTELEARIRSHDGGYRWFMCRATPYLDKQGRTLGWFGTNTDIDELKKTQEELRRSEECHRLIFNSIPGMVSIWSAAGELEMVNEPLREFLGPQLDIPNDHSSALHADDRERAQSAWKRSVATGEAYDVEVRARGGDGTYRWLHTRGLPLRDAKGRVVRWYKLTTDIDDRKKAEEELRRSGARLEQAEELTLTASFEWNATTDELVWSKESYRLLQYDQAVRPRLDLIVERVHPEDLFHWKEEVERARRTGEDVDFEHRLVMPDGSVKHVRVVARATTKIGSGELKYVCAARDITERKQAAEERNRMARDIHDTLAQAFTGVILQLEAARGAIEHQDLAEALERMERSGNLARVGLGEARRAVLALRPGSLAETPLRTALEDLLKRMTSKSGLQATVELPEEEPVLPLEWKEGLLRVTQESLTNTIKHAGAKTFRTTMTVLGKEVHFDLVDDGAGFDPDAEHEGFGLVGMKERIDEMGGQFVLTSAPGRGTRIRIVLEHPREPKSEGRLTHA